jgi:hypothetical protein
MKVSPGSSQESAFPLHAGSSTDRSPRTACVKPVCQGLAHAAPLQGLSRERPGMMCAARSASCPKSGA